MRALAITGSAKRFLKPRFIENGPPFPVHRQPSPPPTAGSPLPPPRPCHRARPPPRGWRRRCGASPAGPRSWMPSPPSPPSARPSQPAPRPRPSRPGAPLGRNRPGLPPPGSSGRGTCPVPLRAFIFGSGAFRVTRRPSPGARAAGGAAGGHGRPAAGRHRPGAHRPRPPPHRPPRSIGRGAPKGGPESRIRPPPLSSRSVDAPGAPSLEAVSGVSIVCVSRYNSGVHRALDLRLRGRLGVVLSLL